MTNTRLIKSLDELLNVTADRKPHHFVIMLNYGLTSRKTIHRWGEIFYVHNHIDETDQKLGVDEIMDDGLTNIGKAIRGGAFYMV